MMNKKAFHFTMLAVLMCGLSLGFAAKLIGARSALAALLSVIQSALKEQP